MAHLGLVALQIRDYDEAIAYFVNALGFEVVEDSHIDDEKRWVVVSPRGSSGSGLLLACASTPLEEARVGDQTGGRVGFFLYTDAFQLDYQRLRATGVGFEEPVRHEPYGTVAVFGDLYGNRWDLIERLPQQPESGDHAELTSRAFSPSDSLGPACGPAPKGGRSSGPRPAP